MKPKLDSEDFTSIYDFFFKELDVTFPLSDFKSLMLTFMDVAPSQLHPNNWAFLKVFQFFVTS